MVSIELDITLLIQAVNFLIALVVLHYVVIKPIRKILKERRDMLAGLAEESDKFNAAADSRLKNYEAELDAARTAAAGEKEQIRQQAVETEQGLLSAAQGEAQSILQKARQELEAEMSASMRALRAQTRDMAGQAVARLLS
ncbi:MAG: ATP synthase F0 subunit B [Deltaproteobacteria bacterium]|jgi:F-type H+-transporting ATPase subunit b|nr:ATP synthase F0 subunit B [Deltaproteobacteria bacterium]